MKAGLIAQVRSNVLHAQNLICNVQTFIGCLVYC